MNVEEYMKGKWCVARTKKQGASGYICDCWFNKKGEVDMTCCFDCGVNPEVEAERIENLGDGIVEKTEGIGGGQNDD